MRQAFIIGAIVLWVALNILGSICEMETPLQQTDTGSGLTQQETLEQMGEQGITDQSLVSGATSVWSKLGDFIMLFGRILTLWHPALWQGDAMLVYFALILPIGLSFWAVILFGIRGVGSS